MIKIYINNLSIGTGKRIYPLQDNDGDVLRSASCSCLLLYEIQMGEYTVKMQFHRDRNKQVELTKIIIQRTFAYGYTWSCVLRIDEKNCDCYEISTIDLVAKIPVAAWEFVQSIFNGSALNRFKCSHYHDSAIEYEFMRNEAIRANLEAISKIANGTDAYLMDLADFMQEHCGEMYATYFNENRPMLDLSFVNGKDEVFVNLGTHDADTEIYSCYAFGITFSHNEHIKVIGVCDIQETFTYDIEETRNNNEEHCRIAIVPRILHNYADSALKDTKVFNAEIKPQNLAEIVRLGQISSRS